MSPNNSSRRQLDRSAVENQFGPAASFLKLVVTLEYGTADYFRHRVVECGPKQSSSARIIAQRTVRAVGRPPIRSSPRLAFVQSPEHNFNAAGFQ